MRFWSPVLIFVVVTLLASPVLVVLQNIAGLNLELIELVQFAPAIGALAVLGRRLPSLIGPGIWAGIADVLAVGGAALLVFIALGHSAAAVDSVALVAPLQLIGAFGEELGWRGFLQPHLQDRFS